MYMKNGMYERMPQVPLSSTFFHILLALRQGERHGYEIMKQVQEDSNSAIKMGPATLYGGVKRMLEEGLIEESDERPDPSLDDERRRYYRMTTLGRKLLAAEAKRLEKAVGLVKKAKLMPGQLLSL
jgi:DNA-binding PadR family transcriptional regulator